MPKVSRAAMAKEAGGVGVRVTVVVAAARAGAAKEELALPVVEVAVAGAGRAEHGARAPFQQAVVVEGRDARPRSKGAGDSRRVPGGAEGRSVRRVVGRRQAAEWGRR